MTQILACFLTAIVVTSSFPSVTDSSAEVSGTVCACVFVQILLVQLGFYLQELMVRQFTVLAADWTTQVRGEQ